MLKLLQTNVMITLIFYVQLLVLFVQRANRSRCCYGADENETV